MENQNPLDKLFEVVSREGLYTKSKNDFLQKYSSPQEIDKLYQVVSRDGLFTKSKDDFYGKYYPDLKKKEPEVSPYVSAPTKSNLPSPDFSQGKKMAEVGFATPQIVSEDVKARKEPKIRVSPKLFAMPGVVDVDIVEEDEDGSYKNLAQNLTNNFLISASDIGAGLAQILREGAPTGVPREKKKVEALYTPEGEKTEYAETVTWAKDPLAKVALGLNGISEPAKELQQTPSAKMPDTYLGNTLTSLSEIVPDLAATALLPEAKAIEGASFLQKTGNLLFNNFTKYLMVKEPLVGYNKAKLEGKDQSATEVLSNVGKGALSGMELALLGAGSSLATKATMKQAAKIGLVGTKGYAAKELVNLATDVVAYGLISPATHTLYEEGRLPTSKEISEGAGIALAFRLKDAIPNLTTFRDLNKAVDNIQQAKQGAALYNFMQATPESIVRVYNGKESANELHLKAMAAAKEAKDAVDPVEKQKAVIKASTMAKAANVKQMADMFVQDKGLADYIQNNQELPVEARVAIAEKANLIRKAVDPIEIQKEQAGQRMQQGQRLIQDLTYQMNGEQDPVKKAELKFRIDQTEKGLKIQENGLMSLIEGQSKEGPLDLTDVNTVKQSKKAFNDQIDLKLQALDKNDPDYFEKVENFNKQREERNDYFDRVIEDKKQDESGVSVMTPEEMNQIDATEISIEPRGQEVEAPVEEIVSEVKTTEIPKQQVNQENRTYTTKTGKQKVDYENGQLIVRDIKTGKEVSDVTRRKAIDEYIESFDFGKGERFNEVVTELPSGLNEEEGKRYIVENSKNPLEVIEMYVVEPKESKLTTEEQMIADYGLGKLTQAGFERFGDENLITGGMAKTYFNKEGTPIDVRAKEMSDYYGKEITPQDIVNFMIAYPSGASQAVRVGETRVAREAAERFKELTGIDLNSKVAERIIDAEIAKAEAFEQELIKQEYETREQLEEEYYRASAEADRLAEEGNRPTAEPAEKTGTIESKKEVTLQDIYEGLPKSEKLRNRQVEEMVDKNFDSIIKQLDKYKIC